MTLAVAIPFPWPSFVEALPEHIRRIALAPGVRFERSILMAADSRWTYKIGTDYDDGGVKLAALGSHEAGVYAGNVRAGELAFARIAKALRRRRGGRQRRPVDLQGILRTVWHQQPDQRGGLQFCVGLADDSGIRMARFESSNGFRPEPQSDIVTLGWPEACTYFRRRFQEEVVKRLTGPVSMSFRGEEWAALAGLIVGETGEKIIHQTVGGPFLVGLVGPGGITQLAVTKIDTSDPDNMGFETVTLTDDQVKEFYTRQRSRTPRLRRLKRPRK